MAFNTTGKHISAEIRFKSCCGLLVLYFCFDVFTSTLFGCLRCRGSYADQNATGTRLSNKISSNTKKKFAIIEKVLLKFYFQFLAVPGGTMTIIGNWSSKHDRGKFVAVLMSKIIFYTISISN